MTSTVAESSPRPAGTYTFSSRPRALPCQRRRYRECFGSSEEEPIRYGNIMYDRRVIRGNTYALHSFPPTTQPDPIELQRQQEIKRKALARKRAREHLRLRSPEPVEGRKHVDVQTELYLEELADRIIEVDMECQTDAFLDRPPTPLFIPAKTGRDVATQILEGELFNFDIEVKPMLEVLVGKTIEQALLEVLEEEELAELRMHQQRFEELRNLELAEVQRLEEQERRHQKEKERRRQQQLAVLHKQNETSQKIAARAYAKIYLADLLPSVFGNLRDNGYFYDPIERDIEIGFLPWLMHEVDKTMEYQTVGRVVLDMMIRDVVENRLKMFEQLGVKESKSIPDENDKERKESLGTGAEQVIEDVNQQDSQQTNGSLEKKPSAEGKLSMERKPSAERKQSTEKDSLEKSASLEKKKSVEKVPSEEIEP
ncbi:radial spoke head protein 3 homolog B-like isoform X1 [Vombatus ursinus]|uniref:Radial spoke head 3 n=2 Tax=Vombatus ursinus TaxID=29139 RepID=A0A4X2LN37_VOMUR|nr:radial spoke head protein 3 homolog B-like isoform X1 [Vombatus ursinus]XP_027702390.1 radial spoke head protein 3 homolog B-like isoform X1 [Vombatus ursinus]